MLRYISEECTRKEFIDPQLEKAVWYLCDKTKAGREIFLFEQERLPYEYDAAAIVARYEQLQVQMSPTGMISHKETMSEAKVQTEMLFQCLLS